MNHIESITVGNNTYNCVMASAVKQDELLSLVTQPIMVILERALVTARTYDVEMGDSILVPMFMAMPYDIKQRVAAILMHKVNVSGTTTSVTVNDFMGSMVEYNTLLSRLIQWNLADFFTWLDSVVKDARPVQPVNQQSTGI